MAPVGTARPGKAGLGYTPRSKQKQTKKPNLIGSAKPGRAGVGNPVKNSFGSKPSFKTPPKQAQKRPAAPKAKPLVAQPTAPDSLYNDQVDLIDRKATQNLSQLEGQESAIKRDFGIEDPADPFSRANAMKQAFLAQRKAASASLAAGGQLYSGAHERALSRSRGDEERARHELRQTYEQAIGQVGAEKTGVKFATEEERNQAFEDWLARAPEADVALTDEDDAAAEGMSDKDGNLSQPGAAPKLAGSRPQEAPISSPAERARVARQAERKSVLIRARAAEKAAKKAKTAEQKRAAERLSTPPKASINRPGAKVKPKPRPKAKPKKGRR